MQEELNYPIKYAVLELKERGGWIDRYEDKVKGYIVSKCYVVETTIRYTKEGKEKITHKVVFPYQDLTLFKAGLRKEEKNLGKGHIPEYDIYGRAYPTEVVEDLFDDYFIAKEKATQKNAELRKELLADISLTNPNWKEEKEKKEEDLLKELSICQSMEEVISFFTEGMEITEGKEKQLIKNKKTHNRN